jgi:hypothetical protein
MEKFEKFLELSKKAEYLKSELKSVNELLNTEMTTLGYSTHFQDPETKLVYEIVQPTGTFIEFKTIGYNRTKTKEEKIATLSATRAKELGYIL